MCSMQSIASILPPPSGLGVGCARRPGGLRRRLSSAAAPRLLAPIPPRPPVHCNRLAASVGRHHAHSTPARAARPPPAAGGRQLLRAAPSTRTDLGPHHTAERCTGHRAAARHTERKGRRPSPLPISRFSGSDSQQRPPAQSRIGPARPGPPRAPPPLPARGNPPREPLLSMRRTVACPAPRFLTLWLRPEAAVCPMLLVQRQRPMRRPRREVLRGRRSGGAECARNPSEEDGGQ